MGPQQKLPLGDPSYNPLQNEKKDLIKRMCTEMLCISVGNKLQYGSAANKS